MKRALQRRAPKHPHRPSSHRLGARTLIASLTRGIWQRTGVGILWLDRPVPTRSDFTYAQWRELIERAQA